MTGQRAGHVFDVDVALDGAFGEVADDGGEGTRQAHHGTDVPTAIQQEERRHSGRAGARDDPACEAFPRLAGAHSWKERALAELGAKEQSTRVIAGDRKDQDENADPPVFGQFKQHHKRCQERDPHEREHGRHGIRERVLDALIAQSPRHHTGTTHQECDYQPLRLGVPRGDAHTHNRGDDRDERDAPALKLERTAPLHGGANAEAVHHHCERQRVPPCGEEHEAQEREAHYGGGAHVSLGLGSGRGLVVLGIPADAVLPVSAVPHADAIAATAGQAKFVPCSRRTSAGWGRCEFARVVPCGITVFGDCVCTVGNRVVPAGYGRKPAHLSLLSVGVANDGVKGVVGIVILVALVLGLARETHLAPVVKKSHLKLAVPVSGKEVGGTRTAPRRVGVFRLVRRLGVKMHKR